MTRTMKILTLLVVTLFTAGQAWAGVEYDLGHIIYTQGDNDGGKLTFYQNPDCSANTDLQFDNGKSRYRLASAELDENRTVYIKATPDFGYTVKEMTITAEESNGSGVAEAPSRHAPGVGQSVTVTPVNGKPGLYSFQMPANGNNVTVTAEFKEKTKKTVDYIGFSETGEVQNCKVEAYVLDGTEDYLGEQPATQYDAPQFSTLRASRRRSISVEPVWYVCDSKKLAYESLKINSYVALILADDAIMSVTNQSETPLNGDSFIVYGQSKGTGSLKITANGKDSSSGFGVYAKKGEISINGGILTISATNYGIATYKDKSSSICDITITGGRITVTATNGIDADGNIILGCRKGTDYIFASSYSNNVIIAGQTLIDGMNAYNIGTISDPSVLSSKILAPDLFGISNGNTGTSSNPYAISTGDGLQLLATYVNNGYVFSDKFFTLNDDIAFNSSTENNFTPIGGKFGKVYYSFCGSFDGDGHTISGIDIDIDDNNYAGIFGYIESEASISNVTLINASISGNKYIGGIVGENNGGSISNCLVTNTTILGSQYTGVIAGLNTSEGILDHNYYSGCTFAGTSNVYNVGCGANETTSDITTLTISETEYLDGAVGYLSETAESNPTLTEGQDVYFFRDFTANVYSTISLPFSYTPNDEGTFYTFTDIQKGNDS